MPRLPKELHDEVRRRAKPAVVKPPKGKRETVETVEIPIPATAEELAKHSREFVVKSLEVDRHQDEKRQFLSEWRESHEALKEEHDRLRSIVNDKAVPRMVKAVVLKDFEKGEVRYLDPRTRKELHRRDITKDDEQLNIEGTEPARTGGDHVSDKKPAGEKDGRLTGASKESDVTGPPKQEPR